MQPSPPRQPPRPGRSQPFALVIALALVLVAALLVWRTGAAASLFGDEGHPGAAGTTGGGTRGSEASGPSASASPAVSVPAPPACRYGSKPAAFTAYGQWKTTLLDTTFRLRASYEPRDLVSVASAGFDGGLLVRHLVVRDLADLREAAQAAGHPIEIVAAYRSYEYQADLFQRRMQRLGVAEAQRKTARPGHSEHQLGTVLDFKRAGAPTTTQAFGGTPTGKWLTANAASFGFVLSYPEGEDSITCYGYEPWHFRYFGRKTAAKIAASGLTTREYLWAHRPERAASPSPGPDASTPSASGAAPTTSP